MTKLLWYNIKLCKNWIVFLLFHNNIMRLRTLLGNNIIIMLGIKNLICKNMKIILNLLTVVMTLCPYHRFIWNITVLFGTSPIYIFGGVDINNGNCTEVKNIILVIMKIYYIIKQFKKLLVIPLFKTMHNESNMFVSCLMLHESN